MKLGIIAIMLGMAMLARIASSQVPGLINYQGRLTDQAGVPLRNVTNNVADGWIDLTFRIFNATGGGNQVWGQINTDVEVNNGLSSVLLTGLTTNVFPANNQVSRWLEVEVRTNGVVTSVLAPRKEIVSVAYAFRAGDADTVDGLNANQLGGITTEIDPQVADNLVNNSVPRWNSATTQLVTGTIVDNGSIGIGGTAGAGYRLDVMGQAIVRDHLTVSGGDIWMNASSTIKAPTGRLNIESGEHLILSPAAKVGIGTPSPAAKLDVNGDSLFRGPLSVSGAALTIDRDGGQLKLSGGTYNGGLWTAGGKLYLANWDTGAGAAVNLQNGNVGIGTPNPGYALHLNTDRTLRLEGPSAANDNYGFSMGGYGFFGIDAPGVPNGRFVVKNNGNVGIGITPHYLAKLDVNGHAAIRRALAVGWDPPPDLNPNYLNIQYPDIRLGVVGNVFISGGVNVNGVWVHSDDRVKFNEQKLEYGLAQVMALEPKRYDHAKWEYDPETEEIVIHPETTTNEIGLVAQDVHKVIPEAVSVPENENARVWSLSYDTIIPVLVKAIQEQQAQIEELKNEIQAMKSGI